MAANGSVHLKIGDARFEVAPGELKELSAISEKNTSWIDGDDGYDGIAPVGQFRPNPFGLFDMHGNVWEWCDDGFEGLDYTKQIRIDPRGPTVANLYALRGGCYL